MKDAGLSKVQLRGDKQLLRLTAEFHRRFSADDLPLKFEQRDLVHRLQPEITGELDLFLGAAGTLVSTPSRIIQLRLLPALRSVRIQNITPANQTDLSIIGDVLTFLVNQYMDNISGRINQSPFLELPLPTTLQDSFDPATLVNSIHPTDPNFGFSLSSKPIKSLFGLAAIVWLIDDKQVGLMAQFVPAAEMPPESAPEPSTYDALRTEFEAKLKGALGIASSPGGIWMALSKSLLAKSLDSVLEQAQPCFRAKFPIPKESFSSKIHIPDETQIDCTPKSCPPALPCDLKVDQRNCRSPRNCAHGMTPETVAHACFAPPEFAPLGNAAAANA